MVLNNGVLLQFGRLTNVGGFTISFPLAFTNTNYSCVITARAAIWFVLQGNYNTTSCSGWLADSKKGTIQWFAIGN